MSHNKEELNYLKGNSVERKHYDNNYYGVENVTSFNCKGFELLGCILSCCKQAYIILFQINIGQWHA